MAKPQFQHKPNKPTSKQVDQRVELVGTGDVVALYADVFVVVNEADTGLGSLYFYQRQLSDSSVVLGRTETTTTATVSKAKCIGRVLLSQPGIEKLLEALAENRGFVLARKSPSEKEQK